MKSYVSKEDIELSSSSSDGEPISYKVNLEKIHIFGDEHAKFVNVRRELRDLSRSKSNLQNSLEVIFIIEELVKTYGFSRDHKVEFESHLCRAVILYGACFLQGGQPRVRPLKHDRFSEQEYLVHKEIMDYRDKLFGHLDDNHKVRSDQNKLEFSIQNNRVQPLNITAAGSKTIMTGQAFSERWKNHIQCLIGDVNLQLSEKEQEMISFLKDLEIFIQTS